MIKEIIELQDQQRGVYAVYDRLYGLYKDTSRRNFAEKETPAFDDETIKSMYKQRFRVLFYAYVNIYAKDYKNFELKGLKEFDKYFYVLEFSKYLKDLVSKHPGLQSRLIKMTGRRCELTFLNLRRGYPAAVKEIPDIKKTIPLALQDIEDCKFNKPLGKTPEQLIEHKRRRLPANYFTKERKEKLNKIVNDLLESIKQDKIWFYSRYPEYDDMGFMEGLRNKGLI